MLILVPKNIGKYGFSRFPCITLYNAKHNGDDIVNSYGNEYSQLKGTTLIGTIQKEDEKDEDSLLEVSYA